ncbi:FtsB family cell division protein [Zunongwangia sp.]|uniref:FtsB family cell division protein n=1 Tax=Zunongwangia sp. TaxID=1965325 RepID=UPI003AA8BC1F
MKLKKLSQKRWFRILRNKYVLLSLIFAVWMFFFDSNSYFVHRELNGELEELENNKAYFEKEINKDEAIISKLEDTVELEKFARQKYYMKRPNEEIYIVEYDTID